jgi:hypothetical protein
MLPVGGLGNLKTITETGTWRTGFISIGIGGIIQIKAQTDIASTTGGGPIVKKQKEQNILKSY